MSVMAAPPRSGETQVDPISNETLPLRAEGTVDTNLEEAARRDASLTTSATPTPRRDLLARVHANHRDLIATYRDLSSKVDAGTDLTPEAEWLLDNFYVIDEVFREVLTDLPRSYLNELPTTSSGPFAGLPRTYALALSLIVQCDSVIDEPRLLRFVRAFQEVCPLTIGESWAVPIMLRVGLLENLARLARQMNRTREQRSAAERAVHSGAVNLPEQPSDAFVTGLLHALRELHEVTADLAERVQVWLQHLQIDPAELLHREHQRQATNQVSIGNAVTTLRLLAALDWSKFFEAINVVEQVLRSEPTGTYERQTFATRDSYRAAVEALARGSRHSEPDLARLAIDCAGAAIGPHESHLGHYLVGAGRRAFEKRIGYRPRWRDLPRRWMQQYPNRTYFSLLGLFTGVALAAVIACINEWSWFLLPLLVLAVLPATEVAVALLNFVLCRLLAPRALPRLDFRTGIPDEFRTFVVIPGMLTRKGSAQALLDRLELHYLANPDPNLVFALLTDFADATAEEMPEDHDYLQAAFQGVAQLNEKYAAGEAPRFFVLHRKRLHNASENSWLGWERKRGKLHEFNRLLRGATDTTYVHCSVNPTTLPRVRFVLTLDSDTVLPRDSARLLIGTLAHPLNAPVVGADGRVVAGYSILQPRVSFLYKAGWRSLFARLYAYSAGIDPYSTAISDTYMDLFGRGTFTGKGLYDVDAFEATAGQAFPDNHILSHDLIESNFARCALVSNVEVFDDFPARYTAYSRREHRWARGDWQLLPWLRDQIPTAHQGHKPNPLPLLERWKIVDNLRRSLAPLSLLLLLLVGWVVLPSAAWVWSLVAVGVLGVPALLHLVSAVLGLPAVGIRQAWVNSRAGFVSTIGQSFLSAVFLAHHAVNLLDAIVRTLARLFVTRKHLLEWETAAATEARLSGSLLEFLRALWIGPVVACAGGLLVAWLAPSAMPWALPFVILWFLSPLVAWGVSRPAPPKVEVIDPGDRPLLRRLACKTWGFFEVFVGAEDNWLPPDNYQETPVEAVAHRTSPTNMGLLLTSTLAAHDLGYLTLSELADRIERTLQTFARMERYRGHFLNWYDTRTLAPLPPAYVSSVDSGNLLACLLVLENGLLEKLHKPIITSSVVAGLADRMLLLRESAGMVIPVTELDQADSLLRQAASESSAWPGVVDRLGELCARWTARADKLSADGKNWLAALGAALEARRAEVKTFFRDTAGTLAEQGDSAAAAGLSARLRELATTARRFADAMDFHFLYNSQRNLFAIGYHVPREMLDQGHYDLLASEASLTSFLAVARGTAPRRHWFQLGRLFIDNAGEPGLMSWGGTMFEYLMPRLFLSVPSGTLLHTAWKVAVARQIEYGRQNKVPWGISESAYALTDAAGNYQYQAFGVPGLGLKRGLARDLVIAPYATVLALQVAPREAAANLRQLIAEGGEGRFGMYEAIDHTPDRLPPRQTRQVIASYMAHHQGMSLLAIVNTLLGDLMPSRLSREPAVRAVDLLLEERVPLDAPVLPMWETEQAGPVQAGPSEAVSRRLTNPSPREPRPHLLSNGRYSVMLTSAGSGYSTHNGIDVTRWRADPMRENYGTFIYIRDLVRRDYWSAVFQPVLSPADSYEVIFSIDKAEFRQRIGDLESHTEVAVSPAVDAEVRRVTLINHAAWPREIELTSYSEVVLMPHAADVAHPAFHKLFLETEWIPEVNALVCRRRPRAADQLPQLALHLLTTDSQQSAPLSYETDRARFLGRRGDLATPAAMFEEELSATVGPVLDPIFALRCRLTIPPSGRATVCFVTAVAESRDKAVGLASQLNSPAAVDRVFELAWAHSRVELKHFNLSIREAQLYLRLAGHVLYPPASLRAAGELLQHNRQGQMGLWRHGISGDLPIVVVRMPQGPESIALFRRVLTAHSYWHARGLRTDLVVLNESPTSYHDDVANEVMSLIRASEARDRMDRPGGVFVRKADQFSPDDWTLLCSWARVLLDPRQGTLEDLVGQSVRVPRLPASVRPSAPASGVGSSLPVTPGELKYLNGTGGFTPDGREYVIVPGKIPPMPWVNVISNPSFGFLVSDSGSGYAWATNSQLNRLTPWSNDPVSDPPNETIFLRDESSGDVWTPTPLPAGGPTLVRHGAGYSVFEQRRGALVHELTVFVPVEEAVKISRLRITNNGSRTFRLGVTYYVEWVLGTHRDLTAPHLVTEYLEAAGALVATNSGNPGFPPAVGFAALSPQPLSWTADRWEFVGRNRLPGSPAALERISLSGRTGAGIDPCAALQTIVEIASGDTVEVICLLGTAPNTATVTRLVETLRHHDAAAAALKAVMHQWDEVLTSIQVQTPDGALDLLLNRWLLYQVISCRLWGRTGFYQSGGAYGFRDQLQDVMALVHAAPLLAREQIVRAAARQFREGDVQHWWHPPTGQGVRTRFSDDFLWLVLVTCHYANATGDHGIFDESIAFLDAPTLEAHQEEVFIQPQRATESAPLYDHCLRALEHGWKLGAHGLPLMGIGDWNDGMNKVGAGGRGETVWGAWFQIVCLEQFAQAAARRNDSARADVCRGRAEQLRKAAEEQAWDGQWYRRAYFDDGTPLGSSSNDECRIDSIAQSWAVLAAADPVRSAQAVTEAVSHLVKMADQLVLLFDPPFDSGPLQPGYIKGYVPGTRENGGQYTHAAIWLAQALARRGLGGQAGDLIELLLPVHHADTPEKLACYRVEPYVVAADVYGRPPHVGRGGWTWYTGSAGWLYQVVLGDLLGVRRSGALLVVDPCVPSTWKQFHVSYRHGSSRYEVEVENPRGVERGIESLTVDGQPVTGEGIPLLDDGKTHHVVVRMGGK